MTAGPTFTIITANRNSDNKLTATCRSVRAQGLSDWEHLIIDGLSDDSSLDIATTLAATDVRVRVVPGPDRGIYDAMNKGVRQARGRYILFLGAGDCLMPGVLGTVARLLPRHDRGFVYGDVLWLGLQYDGPFDWLKLCGKNICHQAIFYGRDIFFACGEFDQRYRTHADWEMNFRCFGRRTIQKQYVPLVIAHFEEGGVSASGDLLFERDKILLIRRHLGILLYCKLKLLRHTSHLLWRVGHIINKMGARKR